MISIQITNEELHWKKEFDCYLHQFWHFGLGIAANILQVHLTASYNLCNWSETQISSNNTDDRSKNEP